MKLLSLLLLLVLAQGAQATTIAIIDSGTDLNHKDLKDKKWFNLKDVDDAVDNDNNGLIDDVNGWNFAENNNKLFDKKLIGTFSADVYKFFEVQTRMLKGEATQEDKDWYAAARSNAALLSELGVFGNFVHGSHVAGIAAKNAPEAKIMVLKIIPTKSPVAGGGSHSAPAATPSDEPFRVANGRDALIRKALSALAAQQAKGLAPIGTYVGKQKARIANCSFGTSTTAAQSILGPLLKLALGRDASKEELKVYSSFFVSEITKAAKAFFTPAPNTLFVIAAGNDGTDNDALPTSPANVKLDNTITVAATLGFKKLASFSNYGATMVEVAAPGVGIESSIPGNAYLTVSGTSQASPYVANVAGLIVDENPSISNSDIKAILMGTTDQKEFLAGKVISGGIVNTNRAVLAARLSKTMQLSEAISTARVQVNDVPTTFTKSNDEGFEGFVMPMPSLFQ